MSNVLISNASCAHIRDLQSIYHNESLCALVKAVDSCKVSTGFLEYTHFLMCFPHGSWIPSILMFCWLLVLLITLATSTDSFFSPCLIVVTRILRMSQNLAGVTLLAFGNGAADIFAALSSINSSNDGDASMAFGSLLGTGLFVNCVTGGIVMIIQPFSCARRPLIKELIFYLIVSLWILSILLKQRIYLAETLGFFGLYAVYVIITVTGRLIYTQSESGKSPDVEMKASRQESFAVNQAFDHHNDDNNGHHEEEVQSRTAGSRSADLGVGPAHTEEVLRKKNAPLKRTFTGFARHNNYLARWVIENRKEEEARMSNSSERSGHLSVRVTPRKRTLTYIPATEPNMTEESTRNRAVSASMRDLLVMFNHQQLTTAAAGGVSPMGNQLTVPGQKITSERSSLECADISPNDFQIVLNEMKMEEINKEGADAEEEPKYVYPGLWQDLLNQLIPIDLDEWKNMSPVSKTLEVVRAPFLLLLRFTTPVVLEDHPIKSWSKILNCLHCITAPCFWILATNVAFITLGSSSFPVIGLFLLLCPLLSLLVWFTSVPDQPPKYHGLFAFVGFVTAIIWIYTIANEIVNMLTSFGIQWNISQAILGLSLLSWANSVGDLMSNLVLAHNNYPRIAYSACVGGPFFSAIFGMGIPFTIKCIQNGGSYPIIPSSVQYVLIGFVLLKILVQLVTIPSIFKFQLSRVVGGMLIGVYCVFFVVAICSELHLF